MLPVSRLEPGRFTSAEKESGEVLEKSFLNCSVVSPGLLLLSARSWISFCLTTEPLGLGSVPGCEPVGDTKEGECMELMSWKSLLPDFHND